MIRCIKIFSVIFMVVVIWGMLAKSQTDSEKIEEAIARLIAAHNDNEEAHLGAGQSLQSHKASVIIDHVVDSVIADKIKNSEIKPEKLGMLIFNTFFESIDGYSKTAGVSIDAAMGYVKLVTTAVINNEQYLEKQIRYEPYLWTWDKDRFFETSIFLDSVANVVAWVTTGGIIHRPHVGFKVEDGFLYGTIGDNVVETTVQLQAVSSVTKYRVKAHLVAGSKVDFYIDDVLKGTISADLPTGIDWIEFLVTSWLRTKVAGVKILYFSYWDIRQSL